MAAVATPPRPIASDFDPDRSALGSALAGRDGQHLQPRKRRSVVLADAEASKTSRAAASGAASSSRHVGGKRAREDTHAWMGEVKEAKTFYPTAEEFANPFEYLSSIAEEASQYGICKIVPPVQAAVPASQLLKQQRFKFSTNVQGLGVQKRAKGGSPKKFFRSGRSYTLDQFQTMANQEMSKRFGASGNLTHQFVEREFWKEMGKQANPRKVEYGSDLEGSGFAKAEGRCQLADSAWNLTKFAKSGLSSLSPLKSSIPGVTEPMLYFGMLFSQFAWHVEDNFLNSINFHHMGAPKFWYGVPSSDAKKFDEIASEFVFHQDQTKGQDAEDRAAGNFIEKTTMFCPKVLVENGVSVYKIVQQPGEFVITFPQAYHGGFSTGFNLGEAVNFATRDWYEYGISAEKRYHRLRLSPVVSMEVSRRPHTHTGTHARTNTHADTDARAGPSAWHADAFPLKSFRSSCAQTTRRSSSARGNWSPARACRRLSEPRCRRSRTPSRPWANPRAG